MHVHLCTLTSHSACARCVHVHLTITQCKMCAYAFVYSHHALLNSQCKSPKHTRHYCNMCDPCQCESRHNTTTPTQQALLQAVAKTKLCLATTASCCKNQKNHNILLIGPIRVPSVLLLLVAVFCANSKLFTRVLISCVDWLTKAIIGAAPTSNCFTSCTHTHTHTHHPHHAHKPGL